METEKEMEKKKQNKNLFIVVGFTALLVIGVALIGFVQPIDNVVPQPEPENCIETQPCQKTRTVIEYEDVEYIETIETNRELPLVIYESGVAQQKWDPVTQTYSASAHLILKNMEDESNGYTVNFKWSNGQTDTVKNVLEAGESAKFESYITVELRELVSYEYEIETPKTTENIIKLLPMPVEKEEEYTGECEVNVC